MSDVVLSAVGVRKSYPSGDRRIEVLCGVDLRVAAGESVSIRGESGSGKSTLLNLLSGLDAPDAGEICWDGSAPAAATRARYLGMVFQSFYLIPELDAWQNVLMAGRMLGNPGAESRIRARDLLERVGLGDRASHLPAQLSGGERQRVAVARALMNSPRLLLADEPTGNLDAATGAGVIDLLFALNAERGTTLILVTHDDVLAQRCSRIVRLAGGRTA